jgi:diketogulonate reductase-like aldo/keto reductase
VSSRRPRGRRSRRSTALDVGYGHIDTAAAYGNEREVGEAIRRFGLDRSDVFVETKVWITDYGYDETLHAFDKSAGKLGIDQIDLLILHQAFPGEFDRTIDAYKALERLLADGNVRAMLRWHLQQGRQVIPKSVTPRGSRRTSTSSTSSSHPTRLPRSTPLTWTFAVAPSRSRSPARSSASRSPRPRRSPCRSSRRR